MLRLRLLLLGLAFSQCCSLTPTITLSSRAHLFPRRNKNIIRSNNVIVRGGGASSDVSASSSAHREKVIVIGGGPIGLAAALVLATIPNKPYDVTLFESTAGSAATSKYDVSKAYLYNVNPRGQVLTKMFPEMQKKLNERGVKQGSSGETKIQYVPADPEEPLPLPKMIKVGGTESRTIKEGEMEKDALSAVDDGDASFWIPRHEMVSLMKEVIEKREVHQKNAGIEKEGRIELIEGKECISVVPAAAEDSEYEQVCVTIRDSKTGKEEQHLTRLVVGADGINSNVRRSLQAMNEDYEVWPGTKHNKFNLKKYITPATGLRLKALQLPPKFHIPNNDGTSIETFGEDIISIRSKNKGQTNSIVFGLLPMKDNDSVRPCNVIQRPNHDIWKLKKDGETYKHWFAEAFPRFPIEKTEKGDALLSDEEWDRFAKAEATSFPPCQHSPGLAATSPQGRAGVVLVGDACHAFSPDIGQGINAGLLDVVGLGRSLQGLDVLTGVGKEKSNTDEIPTIGGALKNYERVRSPEIAALIRLARFGAPYQYRQPLFKDKVGAMLWTSNVVLRLLLNKLTFGIIPKQCAMQMSEYPPLTYRKIMRRADTTTAGLVGAFLAFLWYTLLRKFVNIPFLA